MVEVVLGLYALPVKQATLSKLDGMRQERDAAVCASTDAASKLDGMPPS